VQGEHRLQQRRRVGKGTHAGEVQADQRHDSEVLDALRLFLDLGVRIAALLPGGLAPARPLRRRPGRGRSARRCGLVDAGGVQAELLPGQQVVMPDAERHRHDQADEQDGDPRSRGELGDGGGDEHDG
jgi:hypothetical protein